MADLPFVTDFLTEKDDRLLWIVVVGFLVSFVLAFGLGANDAANSFGTAVGAKVFTLLQAIILASIFETVGAIALGGKVSGTIRGGLFNSHVYDGYERLLMVGQLSALASACVWLLIATSFSLPVSASHSIVGASLGFHLVIFLGTGVDWFVIGKIAISWVASPLISGVLSSCIFFFLKYTMLDRGDQLKWGVRFIPFWYFLVFFINSLSIMLGFEEISDATKIGSWLAILSALGVGLLVGLLSFVFLVPYTRRKAIAAEERYKVEQAELGGDGQGIRMEQDGIEMRETNFSHENKGAQGMDEKANGEVAIKEKADENSSQTDYDMKEHAASSASHQEPPSYDEVRDHRSASRMSKVTFRTDDDEEKEEGIFHVDKKSEEWLSVKDTITVTAICGPLQGLSACFAAFSHGGNDVSNAIGPLIGMYLIYEEGRINTDSTTPYWILVYGGVGIAVGLACLGWRVIGTIGSDLTPMTPSTGFAINLGAAITVLIASNLSIPVSTTHCLVGSVAFVGFIRARNAMDVKLFTGIVSAWIITLPATVILSAAIMGILQHTVPGCRIPRLQYPGANDTLINTTMIMSTAQ